MEKVACTVERITFQNKENGYCVLKVRVKNIRNLITAVGTFPSVFIGSHLELTGVWKTDSKYGKQFQVSEWKETVPATVSGIEKYIGSGLIKGVGPKLAKRIVEHFGTDTLDILEKEPYRLKELTGFILA